MHQRKLQIQKVPESHGDQLVQIEKMRLKVMEEELILSRKRLQVEQSIDINLQQLVRHLHLNPIPSLHSVFRSAEQSPFKTQSLLATPINNCSQSTHPSLQSAFRPMCAPPQSPLTSSNNNGCKNHSLLYPVADDRMDLQEHYDKPMYTHL